MIATRRLFPLFAAAALTLGAVLAPTGATLAQGRIRSEVKIEAVTGEGTDAKSAQLDAFRNAIAQAVGVYVQSDTVVENYVTKSDKIRANSSGFVKSFKKLRESNSGGIVSAVYEVVVTTQPLQADLKTVMGEEFRNVGHPTVSVVGWYQGKDRLETEANSFAVTAMNRALIKRGYKVVDGYLIEKLRKEDQEIVKASGAVNKTNFDQVAMRIANKLKADIYVTTFGSVGQGKASVATRMYNSYTGQIFGDDTGYASVKGNSGADIKAAAEQAVTASMERILPEMGNFWQQVLTQGQEYVIVLEGYDGGKQRRDFKKVLENASGVTEVKQLNAAGNHAEFSVYSSSSPSDLFDDIIGAAEDEGMKFLNDEAVMRGGRAIFIVRK
jgi:hypothetical protein